VEVKWGRFDGIEAEKKLMYWVLLFVLQPYFEEPLDHWLREILTLGCNIGGDPGWAIEHVRSEDGQVKYKIWADYEMSGIEPDEGVFGDELFRPAVRNSLIALAERYPNKSREARETIARYGL